jgi:hypothetical protein
MKTIPSQEIILPGQSQDDVLLNIQDLRTYFHTPR